MKTLKNYFLALTLVVAALSFAACGNNMTKENGTTRTETTTAYNETTHAGNAANMNETTHEGVIDSIEDDIEEGVSNVESGVNDVIDNTTVNNNNVTTTVK